MSKNPLFSLKTIWGRYLIFSIVVLLIALSAFVNEETTFPDKYSHFLFLVIAPHFTYWLIHGFLFLFMQLLPSHGMSKSKIETNALIFMAFGGAIFLFIIVQMIIDFNLDLLPFVSISLSVFLGAFHIYTSEVLEE